MASTSASGGVFSIPSFRRGRVPSGLMEFHHILGLRLRLRRLPILSFLLLLKILRMCSLFHLLGAVGFRLGLMGTTEFHHILRLRRRFSFLLKNSGPAPELNNAEVASPANKKREFGLDVIDFRFYTGSIRDPNIFLGGEVRMGFLFGLVIAALFLSMIEPLKTIFKVFFTQSIEVLKTVFLAWLTKKLNPSE